MIHPRTIFFFALGRTKYAFKLGCLFPSVARKERQRVLEFILKISLFPLINVIPYSKPLSCWCTCEPYKRLIRCYECLPLYLAWAERCQHAVADYGGTSMGWLWAYCQMFRQFTVNINHIFRREKERLPKHFIKRNSDNHWYLVMLSLCHWYSKKNKYSKKNSWNWSCGWT